MSSGTFFKDLESFDQFSGITELGHFKPAPADWYVVATDVVSSTLAIDSGHYKDVNTIGAAAIACAHNAMPDIVFPFVFGGDGASFLIPASGLDAVKAELKALMALSLDRFQLELRASVILISELYELGAKLDVAKFKMKGGRYVGVFRGGGLTLAEKILKEPDNPYSLTADASHSPDLHDLSCRWRPIPSRHGKIVSLLVISRAKDQSDAYRMILNTLEEIVGGPLESVNPVNHSVMSYHSFWQCMKDEVRYHRTGFSIAFIKKMLGILTTVVFDSKKYTDTIPHHSDYRKFDDALRMIIDCSMAQVEEIKNFLEDRYLAGELFYGLHLSDESLMTCYVQSVEASDHIHFIDGGDGGYAAASKQFKHQLSLADIQ